MPTEDENEAIKAKKLDYTLLPAIFLQGTATVLQHGAEKYSRRGYLKGEQYDVAAWKALLRHVVAIQGGENIDPEFGLHHIYHIAANAAMIAHWFEQRGKTPTFPEPSEDTDE